MLYFKASMIFKIIISRGGEGASFRRIQERINLKRNRLTKENKDSIISNLVKPCLDREKAKTKH